MCQCMHVHVTQLVRELRRGMSYQNGLFHCLATACRCVMRTGSAPALTEIGNIVIVST